MLLYQNDFEKEIDSYSGYKINYIYLKFIQVSIYSEVYNKLECGLNISISKYSTEDNFITLTIWTKMFHYGFPICVYEHKFRIKMENYKDHEKLFVGEKRVFKSMFSKIKKILFKIQIGDYKDIDLSKLEEEANKEKELEKYRPNF